jgi:phosphate starvation-inducible protein PhoH and related proteins
VAGRRSPAKKVLTFAADADNAELANLTGTLDDNLRQIETELDVTISRRGHQFNIEGDAGTCAQSAIAVIEHFLERTRHSAGRSRSTTSSCTLSSSAAATADYIQAILAHDISFGVGPAGTGKTYLAVACAVDALERDAVKRIVLTRPAVEAGERLGFLPGDLSQKVDPYLRPLYDALFDLLGFEKTQRMLERQTIEIAPLAYMRGRTLNQAFVILDEAQNTTPEQMKMFLTRIGFGSKAVVTGDVTQIDLPRGNSSGLIEAQHILNDVRGIAFTYFTAADVVRHPLVARIVEAYEACAFPSYAARPARSASRCATIWRTSSCTACCTRRGTTTTARPPPAEWKPARLNSSRDSGFPIPTWPERGARRWGRSRAAGPA